MTQLTTRRRALRILHPEASVNARKLALMLTTNRYSPVAQLKRHTADIEAFKRKVQS